MDTEQMIRDNVGLVYKQLHKFDLAYNDDAISYAMEALWKATQTYDSSKGIKFSTYASTCIYNGIMLYFRSTNERLETVSYESEVSEDIKLVDMLADTSHTEDKLGALYELLYEIADDCAKPSHTEIIRTWLDSNFEVTQTELAKQFGLSQAAISRVLVVYKYKLKQELEGFL